MEWSSWQENACRVPYAHAPDNLPKHRQPRRPSSACWQKLNGASRSDLYASEPDLIPV